MLLGYARISKSDDSQDTAAQVSALKSAGCKRVFEDKASGGRWDRPELHRLLDQLRAGDTARSLEAGSPVPLAEGSAAYPGEGGSRGRPLPLTHGSDRHLRPSRAHADADARLLCRVRARHGPRADAGGPKGGYGAGPEGRAATKAHAGAEGGDPGRPWLRAEECCGSRAAVSGAPDYNQPLSRPGASHSRRGMTRVPSGRRSSTCACASRAPPHACAERGTFSGLTAQGSLPKPHRHGSIG